MKTEMGCRLKFYISLVCCFLFLASAKTKQPGFRITGKYAMVPDSTVVLMVNRETGKADSTYVMHGEFHFQGHIEYPTLFEFRGLNHKEQKFHFFDHVFVENSIISMEQKNGKLHVTGSRSNDDKNALSDTLKIIRQKFNAVLNLEKYSHQDSLQLEKYFEEYKSARISFYMNNPDSYFTGCQLRNETIPGAYASRKMDLSKKEITAVYAGLTDRIKNSAYGQVVKRYTALPAVPAVGERYADFIFPDVKGVKVKLSDFKGKYILVDFWTSWCSPCRYQNPKLMRLYETYKANNFEIVGVSIDDEKDSWIKAVEKDRLSWINVLSEGGRSSEVSLLYGINGLPDNILINPDGIIVKRNMKADELEELLANLFSKK